ncbi:MAG: discoidin domain-containing protein [Fibrobacterales bacterium]
MSTLKKIVPAVFITLLLLAPGASAQTYTNISVNRSQTASSYRYHSNGYEYIAINGNDNNNGGTHWESEAQDNEWFQIDLGTVQNLGKFKIYWETRYYAVTYEIVTSLDGTNWTVAEQVTNGVGNTLEFYGSYGSARYVKLNLLTRSNSSRGFSFYEFKAYKTEVPVAKTTSVSWLGELAAYPEIESAGNGMAFFHSGLNQSFIYNDGVWDQFAIGETGATGPIGAEGAEGLAGIAGAQGSIGEIGAMGDTGPMGPAGPAGPIGPIGATGAVGPAGATGTTGAVGATGAAGATGATGATGAIGATGAAGATGATGIAMLMGGLPPTAALGSDGDKYLDYNVGIYFEKVAGTWNAVNIPFAIKHKLSSYMRGVGVTATQLFDNGQGAAYGDLRDAGYSTGDLYTAGIIGSFIDARDSESYNWVKIASQTWMSENLNYSGHNTSNEKAYTTGYCFDATDHSENVNCTTYGRLYSWAVAKTSPASAPATQGVCPDGWHMPSMIDWEVLGNYIAANRDIIDHDDNSGTWLDVGEHLKAQTEWWSETNNDTYGFQALPGGYRFASGYSTLKRNEGFWWSTDEESTERAYFSHLVSMHDDYLKGDHIKTTQRSVRCLKNML